LLILLFIIESTFLLLLISIKILLCATEWKSRNRRRCGHLTENDFWQLSMMWKSDVLGNVKRNRFWQFCLPSSTTTVPAAAASIKHIMYARFLFFFAFLRKFISHRATNWRQTLNSLLLLIIN
jgi:hypothetical protein